MEAKPYVIERAGDSWLVKNQTGDAILCGHDPALLDQLASALRRGGASVTIVVKPLAREPQTE